MSPENKQKVLDSLDIQAEYAAMGLKVHGEAKDSGWTQCHAFGRTDNNPSASVCFDRNDKGYGKYIDFGTQQHQSIFDFRVTAGLATNAVDAFNFYAEKAGLVPDVPPPKQYTINEKFKQEQIHDSCEIPYLQSKPPCTYEGLTACGGMKADTKDYGTALLFPIFDDAVDPKHLLGGAVFNWFGGLLYDKKNLMIKGTKSGLMGQHGLNLIKAGKAEIVYFTEGIPDMVSLQSAIPADRWDQIAVITRSNGISEHPKDWQMKFLAGQNVIVIADADEPGIAGAEKLTSALAKHAKSVRLIKLPYEVQEKHGKDLRDWLGENHTFAELEVLASEAKNVEASDEVYSPEFCEKMLKDLNVCIFGQDELQQVSGYSFTLKRWFTIKDRNRYTHLNLIGDCGQVAKKLVAKTQNDDNKEPYHFKQVVEMFCLEAAKKPIHGYDLHGQGIWLDPQTQDVVIVLGNGQAAVWNGVTLEHLTMPYHGDLPLNFQAAHTTFADFDKLKEALENYDESKPPVAFAELRKILMQWNWQANNRHEKENAVTLVSALIAATFVQSTFKFRPMVCVTGQSQSGKTELQRLLQLLFGKLSNAQSKPSSAAIRQTVGCNSNVLLLDEMEKDKYRTEILELLRTSTDGTYVTRASANQKNAMKFGLKHIVWISSIEMNLANLADASRFFQLELKRPERQDGKRAVLKMNAAAIKRIGFDLMVFAVKNIKLLLENITTLSEADIENCSIRNIESAALPAAFAELLCGWTREETLGFMWLCIDDNKNQKVEETIEDHDELLQSILFRPIRTDYGELSVAQAVKKVYDDRHVMNDSSRSAAEALVRNGIKVSYEPDGTMVFFAFAPIKASSLLKDTKWAAMDIGRLLKRCNNGKISQIRLLGRTPSRGICFPIEWLIEVKENDESAF